MRKNAIIITGFIPPPKRLARRIQSSSSLELIRSAQAVIGASADSQMIATIAAAPATATPTAIVILTRVPRNSSRTPPKSRASCSSRRAKSPATHQKAKSHAGDSRPRNDSSSIPRGALQQRRFTETIGDGHHTDSTSSAMNAKETVRRLASIDIEPLSDHPQLVHFAIRPKCAGDLTRMRTAGGDERGRSDAACVRVANALELPRKVTAPDADRRKGPSALAAHSAGAKRGSEAVAWPTRWPVA